MKVLLVSDIEKLGWLGDVVEVSNGYARNYLLPQGLAAVVTEANVKSLAEEKTRRAEERKQTMQRLEETAATVDGAEVVIAARANEQGRLFGAIAPGQITANLREQTLLPDAPSEAYRHEHHGPKAPASVFEDGQLKVADEVVQLPEPIKQVGTSQVVLKFADDLTAIINVVVVAQQAEGIEPSDEESEAKADAEH